MEKTHWLGREQASLQAASDAVGSEARLIHYDLAGRFGVKAAAAETQVIELADSLPPAIYVTAKASRAPDVAEGRKRRRLLPGGGAR